MHVHGHWQLILQSPNSCLLVQQILLQQHNLLLQVINTLCLLLCILKLLSKLSQIALQLLKLALLISEIGFALSKIWLSNFDLLIKLSQLLISLYKLASENISLINNHLIVLLLPWFLRMSLRNDIFKPGNLLLLVLDDILSALNILLDSVFLDLGLLILLYNLLEFSILIHKSSVLQL